MSDKKKVVVVLSSFESGGAEKMMINLANGFHDEGYHTTVVVLRLTGPFKVRLNEDVTLINGPTLPNTFMYIPWLAFTFFKLKADIILSTQRHINIITYLSSIISNQGGKIVFREANPPSVSSKKISSLFAKLSLPLSKIIYPKVKKHIAISAGVRDDMIDYYKIDKHRVRAIYNPVISDECVNLSTHTLNDAWINGKEPVLLAVGRISPVKDYLTMIKAFKKVRLDKDCKLVILGNFRDDEYFQSLQNLIVQENLQSYIRFTGFVDNPYPFMVGADVFVLSSKWEGFGNVIVEALYCGCPVVATDCTGGPREILEHGKYGKLVPVGDCNKMAKAILDTLENPPEAKMLKERGSMFTQKRSVQSYLDFIFDKKMRNT